MKSYEIESIYTAKVAEYLGKGYTINPGTMAGHQGEISKIDLKKGDEIIRILLENTHCWDRDDEVEVEGVYLKVGRSTEKINPTRPFDTWQTIWNENLEILEQRTFYQIRSEADFFTEDFEEYKAMKTRQHEHWKNSQPTNGISESNLTSPKAVEIAIRYLKRRTGKSRILRDGIEINKRVSRNGKSQYTVEYSRRAYALH